MNRLFSILSLLTIASCSSDQTHNDGHNTPANPAIANTSPTKKTEPLPECIPSQNFLSLIKHMDSCSYHIDTSTINKSTQQFDNIKLNQEYYSNTYMHAVLKDPEVYDNGSQSLVSVNYDPKYDVNFGKVKCIWTYSWRIPDAKDGLKRRGTVEEWKFDSDSSAKFAYNFLINENKKIGFPYCLTPGFYLQCGKNLYLFHSDHTGVGYRHQPFHKWLSKKCNNN